MSDSFNKIQNFVSKCNRKKFMKVVDFALGKEGLVHEVYDRLKYWDEEQLNDFIEHFGIDKKKAHRKKKQRR